MKVRYIIPSSNEDGFEEVIVTINEAIRLQREAAEKANPDFVYDTDEDALQDYLTIHWAEIISG